MGFALKKFLSFWIMPVPLCLWLLALGYLLLFTKRRSRAGRALIGLALALLLLFSNRAVSRWLIRPLEKPFAPIGELRASDAPPAELASCRYIVVLGGGHADAPGFSSLHKLSTSALGRLAEGVRLARALPEATLVVCGPGAPGRPSHAEVLADAAASLGIDRTRIVTLDSPRDTEEEAAALVTLVRGEKTALVSSAWHLRRAIMLMRNVGLDPLPCPADFTAKPGASPHWSDYLWDTESLGRSTWAVYERVGYLWAALRGKTRAHPHVPAAT